VKTATALTIATIGAILAFAVDAHPFFFSFHVAGWVLMLAGVVGAFLPRRGSGWLRRRMVRSSDLRRTDVVQGRDVDVPQDSFFARILMPGGLVTEYRDVEGYTEQADGEAEGDVESDTIEEYIRSDN
jgi:hypothetical protein